MDANVTAGGPKSLGVTPLHLAAKGGHLRVMDELLERGADIDARTKGVCGCKYLHSCKAAFPLLAFSKSKLVTIIPILCQLFCLFQGLPSIMLLKKERGKQSDS